jgi:hypothetical protein
MAHQTFGSCATVARVRRTSATTGFLAVTLALALALTGCGGSSAKTNTAGSTGAATPTPTLTAPTPTTPPAGGSVPAPIPFEPVPSTGPTLTKQVFITRADVICTQAQAEFAAQQKQIDAAGKADQAHDTPANRMAVANALRADLTLAEQQLDHLRALQPPAADRPSVAAYFAAVASQLMLVSRLASGIAANDAVGVSRINSELDIGVQQARTLAAAYGFKVCGAATA